MKTEKFLLQSGTWRARLDAVTVEMLAFAEDNSTLESGIGVDDAAGAVVAATTLLELIEEKCLGEEFIP